MLLEPLSGQSSKMPQKGAIFARAISLGVFSNNTAWSKHDVARKMRFLKKCDSTFVTKASDISLINYKKAPTVDYFYFKTRIRLFLACHDHFIEVVFGLRRVTSIVQLYNCDNLSKL